MSLPLPGSTLHFITWNTCGIKSRRQASDNDPKLNAVLDQLKVINSSVAFLQETHVGPKDVKLLRKVSGWKSFFTVFHSKSKGVAILIKDTITDFKYICHDEDHAGGYIVLFCQMYGQLFTLVNVYNHKDDHTILKRLGQYLKNTATGTLVVGGDFNTVLDPKIDRSGTSDNHQHKAFRVYLQKFTSSLKLVDIWRIQNPTSKDFTYSKKTKTSKSGETQCSESRLDMFFVPEFKGTHNITHSCRIHDICEVEGTKLVSDHKPVILEFYLPAKADSSNPSTLECRNTEVLATLPEDQYNDRTGKISGSEIVMAIESLTGSGQPTLGTIPDLKTTERLKQTYNKEHIDTEMTANEGKIFAKILESRLQMYLQFSIKEKNRAEPLQSLPYLVKLEIATKIKRNFLKEALLSIKCSKPSPKSPDPIGFTFLREVLSRDITNWSKLLPIADPTLGDKRWLNYDCPLTQILLALCLKNLRYKIHDKTKMTSVWYFRRCCLIHLEEKERTTVTEVLLKFKKDSGLRINRY
uniref:uncharacterized protein LOC124005938 n=1 Tax=Oncorhynchus gorbuscha TaxID=8017 RepID=UPI001EAE848E|nr:uncharacterized protein LOC124005938 [Oncorhynchus gorbuscha]XP_046171539.1 uncharacterized protein LOC124005938 [Oncorhynchus gorbuscha]XP_046171540.1 uncharacterized protein LOC124005938 [Oncorhynchus gorbuscha]